MTTTAAQNAIKGSRRSRISCSRWRRGMGINLGALIFTFPIRHQRANLRLEQRLSTNAIHQRTRPPAQGLAEAGDKKGPRPGSPRSSVGLRIARFDYAGATVAAIQSTRPPAAAIGYSLSDRSDNVCQTRWPKGIA